MSLVGRVGRKRPRARLAIGFLYLILTLGAVTTLYPFALMVSTGFKGATDQNDNRLLPKFWSDTEELYAKYIDDKYSGDASLTASTRAVSPEVAVAEAEKVSQYTSFLEKLPADLWIAGFRNAPNQVTGRLNVRYQSWLRTQFGSIEELNKAYVEENLAFQTVQPPAEPLDRKTWKPVVSRRWTDWLKFKETLPAEFRVPVRLQRMYQDFIRVEYRNRFEDVPAWIAGSAKTFDDLKMLDVKAGQEQSKLLEKFYAGRVPERYRAQNAETEWAKFSGINAPIREIQLPAEAFERDMVAKNAASIKGEFTGRNYRYVLDYILINGRAVQNTAAFCLLAILTQLLVNPLAAYALSRYPIKVSGQILIFLLATMAFPAEVAMIPSFLLLKDLGLLNTFAALILPAAASGYMIFLLKGFFDSLPQELFEAGQLDGAREWVMMLKIAFPLSRPVLGYLALLAFMSSYSAFIYAFLVVQDQKMWTLMVWLYQLQMSAPRAVVMAALALAALPTLIVFLSAQRVIMRGIVLPGER